MGYGYDESRPSMPPFMWVERKERVGSLAILAFGAYNAFGLIGTEKGGVAIVDEERKLVLATRDIPFNAARRGREVDDLMAVAREGGEAGFLGRARERDGYEWRR